MSLRVGGQSESHLATLTVEGEVDARSAPTLTHAIDRAVTVGASVVALDLTGMTFIDSSGLGAILSRHKLLSSAGGLLVLLHPSAETRRLLDVTHLGDILDVRDEAPSTDECADVAERRAEIHENSA